MGTRTHATAKGRIQAEDGEGKARKARLESPAVRDAFKARMLQVVEALGGIDATTRRIAAPDRGTVRAWVDSKNGGNPTFSYLWRLADASGLSLDWLAFGSESGEAIYRGQSWPRSKMETEMAAHVARESRELGEMQPTLDTSAFLATITRLASDEREEWRRWHRKLIEAVRDAHNTTAGILLVPPLDGSPEPARLCAREAIRLANDLVYRFFGPHASEPPPATQYWRATQVTLAPRPGSAWKINVKVDAPKREAARRLLVAVVSGAFVVADLWHRPLHAHPLRVLREAVKELRGQ